MIRVEVPALTGTLWDDAAVNVTNLEMPCDVNTRIMICCGVRACSSEEPIASICGVEEEAPVYESLQRHIVDGATWTLCYLQASRKTVLQIKIAPTYLLLRVFESYRTSEVQSPS